MAAPTRLRRDVIEMRWHKEERSHDGVAVRTIRSDAGYAVLQCTANKMATGRYVAFKVNVDRREVLGGYDSAEEAKLACEHHNAKRMEEAAA